MPHPSPQVYCACKFSIPNVGGFLKDNGETGLDWEGLQMILYLSYLLSWASNYARFKSHLVKKKGKKNELKKMIFSIIYIMCVGSLNCSCFNWQCVAFGYLSLLQVAVLEHVDQPTEKLCVANTHLYFHPRAAHIRLVQSAIVIRHLEELRKSYKAVSR